MKSSWERGDRASKDIFILPHANFERCEYDPHHVRSHLSTYQNDGVLHERFGTDELVVGSVVDNVENTSLPRDSCIKHR